MFAHAEVNDAAFVRARFKVAAAFDVGVVRNAEIGRAANQHRQVRRERIDDFATRHARRHRLRIFERPAGAFPSLPAIRRSSSSASACPAPDASRSILLDQRVPLRFLLRAAIDRFAKMRQRFVGNVKLLVFRPAEMSFRFAHRFFARRIAVGFARAGGRHAETNDRLH